MMERDEIGGQKLFPFTYEAFPLGTVSPRGWLSREIDTSGRGLGGHLFYFYRFVKESSWLGGQWEYSALNEAAPYWYNYIVPLAYTASDQQLAKELQAQANHFLDYTLQNQAEDGWLGPERSRETRGIWARCLLLQGLINHMVADRRRYTSILEAMLRFVRLVHGMLKDEYTGYLPGPDDKFDPQWFGVARAHELSLNLQWLHGTVSQESDRIVIWDVMELMWEGSRKAGRDWTTFFDPETFPKTPAVRCESPNFQHGVNVAQGLRYPAQLFRMHPSETLRKRCYQALQLVTEYHGTAAGSFSSDEYIGGLSPRRGSELCCAVELQFSLSYLYQLFGDGGFADRVEEVVFNAFQAAVSSDWWSHQYVTQINQPWACELEVPAGEKSPFYDVCRYANVFGLEPEFPCCTVNHPTALPKLSMITYLSVAKNAKLGLHEGILHAHLAASALKTTMASIECETTYPFGPLTLNYTISTSKGFDFYIRIPQWATNASTIRISGQDGQLSNPGPLESNIAPTESAQRLRLYRVSVPMGSDFKIEVQLGAEIQVRQHESSVTIHRGPLLYALDIKASKTSRMPRNYRDQRSDCQEVGGDDGSVPAWMRNVRDHDLLPADVWAVALDLSAPLKFVQRQAGPKQLGVSAWDSAGASSHIEAQMEEISWPVVGGVPADPKDVDLDTGRTGRKRSVQLIPFGCAKLHMAQFPVLRSQGSA